MNEKRNNMNRIFYSKVDWWYYVVIALCGWVMVDGFWVVDFIAAFMGMVTTWLTIQILTHMRYIITSDDMLIIEMGRPFPPVKIAITDIIAVKRSRSLLSSPALSLDRVKITYRSPKGAKKDICISPLKREEMMQVLKKRNPQIEINV